jgi:hypothetical protein
MGVHYLYKGFSLALLVRALHPSAEDYAFIDGIKLSA